MARHLLADRVKLELGIPGSLPCDYWAWKRRDEPDSQPRRQQRVGARPRIAVVIHVYYPELLGELLGALASIPEPYDLFITNASDGVIEVPNAKLILPVENRGRDLWPLLQLAQSGHLDGYELILKLHTKRSPDFTGEFAGASSGEAWRRRLLSSLTGDGGTCAELLALFLDPGVGLVTDAESILGPEWWGKDLPATRHLGRRLGLRIRRSRLRFAAGSMYWIRGSVVRRLQDLRMSAEDFQAEGTGWDTTTAHALERLIGIVVRSMGMEVVGVQPLAAGPHAA